MGVTQRLGTIPLAIQTDSSNNVGIGGAANASYKLAVTGSSLFTSALTSTNSAGTFFSATNTVGGFAKLEVSANATSIATLSFTNSLNLTGGNVGIGTSSPDKLLHLAASQGTLKIQSNSTSGANIPTLTFFHAGNDEFVISGGDGLRFLSSGVNERMRITGGGDVYVGTTSESGARFASISDAGNKIAFQGRIPNGAAVPVIQASSVTVGSTAWYAFVAQSGNGSSVTANTMFIYGNGNVVNLNNSYGALSDIKLKENIVDATPKLSDIMQLKVRNFNFKDDINKSKQIGFIAQEIEQIFPGIVEETPDRDLNNNDLGTTTKTVKTSVLIPILIKAIQELNEKVTALENK